MIVVADTSPLIVLINIGQIDLLPKLFHSVLVPPEVVRELGGSRASPSVSQFAASPPAWLTIQAPHRLLPGLSLHPGEVAAISLAIEMRAELLLMDEKEGRLAATRNNLAVAGTVGVLEKAAAEKFVNLKEAFDALKRTDFWIPHAFLDARLQAFELKRTRARDR
jgi:predicted nucleic acid-binding protein